jgi:hypothetical protein
LNGVLGVRVVLENGADGAIETLVVAAHEDLEEVSVPCTYSSHDFLVGERTGLKRCYHRVLAACQQSLHAVLLALHRTCAGEPCLDWRGKDEAKG